MSETFRIHYLVPAADGPIVSGAAGVPHKISEGGRFVFACDASLTLSLTERGTDCPWAVHCVKCEGTEVFKANNRPKPGQRGPERSEERQPCGGCG